MTIITEDIPDCGDFAFPKENYMDSIGLYFEDGKPKRIIKMSYEYRAEQNNQYGNIIKIPFAWFLIDGVERGFYLYGLNKVEP